MLTGAAVPRLTHILKSIQKNNPIEPWTRDMDAAHLSTWLHCLLASPSLEHAMDPEERRYMAEMMDLPPSYGGTCLYLMEKAADEELLGAHTGITASLISFCMKTETEAYIAIAEALEDIAPLKLEGSREEGSNM
jgi:hypothetical protein